MRVEMRTSDAAWTARYATPGRDGRFVVDVADVESFVFCGRDWVRFDLLSVAPRLPRDWPNRWGGAPREWVVDA